MKKLFFVAFCYAVLMTAWTAHSYAQMCEHMGECMKGGGMMGSGMMGGDMMGSMQHKGMEMMHGKHAGMMESEGPMWKILMKLNLTDQQKDAMKAVRSRVYKEAIRKGAELRIAQMEQKDLLEKDPVDMKAVEATLRQIEMLRTEMHLLFIKSLEEAKSILTPEQKKKFKDLLEKGPMMGGMGMMHGEDCEMMEGEECGMMEGMMQHGRMEGDTPKASDKKEGKTPAEHKH